MSTPPPLATHRTTADHRASLVTWPCIGRSVSSLRSWFLVAHLAVSSRDPPLLVSLFLLWGAAGTKGG